MELSKKEAELQDLEDSQPVHMAKNENVKSMAKRLFSKELNMTQPSQAKCCSSRLRKNDPEANSEAMTHHSYHRPECKGLGSRVISKGGTTFLGQARQDAPSVLQVWVPAGRSPSLGCIQWNHGMDRVPWESHKAPEENHGAAEP